MSMKNISFIFRKPIIILCLWDSTPVISAPNLPHQEFKHVAPLTDTSLTDKVSISPYIQKMETNVEAIARSKKVRNVASSVTLATGLVTMLLIREFPYLTPVSIGSFLTIVVGNLRQTNSKKDSSRPNSEG